MDIGEKIFAQSGEALAQRSRGCPVPGSVQGQAGTVEGVDPIAGRGLSDLSGPFQPQAVVIP